MEGWRQVKELPVDATRRSRGGSATNQPTASNFCLFCSVVQLTGVMFNSPYAGSQDEGGNGSVERN